MKQRHFLLIGLISLLFVACDDKAATKPQQKLSLPKGESTLDLALQKAAPPAEPPRLLADADRLDFAPPPARRGLGLRNRGGGEAVLGPLRIVGDGDFRLSGDCRDGVRLGAGASCDLDIAANEAGRAVLLIDQRGGPSLSIALNAPPPIAAAPPLSSNASKAREALSFGRLRQNAGLTVNGAGNEARHEAREDDYAESGLPGVVSSFPVDRRRVLTADRYIPAVLENSLNSQLPGRAIAVVERPVFGEDGAVVLIPAGSRVIGHYRAQSKYGLARLDVAWTRILRPDGGNINLEADSADVMGRAGIPGDLDQRFLEKYASALLVSIIGAGGDWALADNSQVSSTALGATTIESGRTQAANRFGNDMEKLGQRVVEDNIDVRPVLTVPHGTRLLIIPTEDIWLRDPEHLRPVSPPKDKAGNGRNPVTAMQELLPSLIELLAQSPSLQKSAPMTAQQILQSTVLQQMRDRAQP